MIYGTHNSLSYLKPRQWWLRPLAWIARCQDMTIEEQLQYGVRYFDIRVKFRNNIAISGHGLMDYDIPVYTVLRDINKTPVSPTSSNTPITARLVLEDRKGNSDRFREFVSNCQARFPDLRIIGGWRKSPFEQIVPGMDADTAKHQYSQYQDYNAPSWGVCFADLLNGDEKPLFRKLKALRFPYPLYWAKRQNARIKAEPWKLWDTVVMDFINIK